MVYAIDALNEDSEWPDTGQWAAVAKHAYLLRLCERAKSAGSLTRTHVRELQRSGTHLSRLRGNTDPLTTALECAIDDSASFLCRLPTALLRESE